MALQTKPDRLREILQEALSLLDETRATPAETPAPWETPEQQVDPDERTITGKVGNPQFSRPKEKSLWKAGIGLRDESAKLRWVNVIAWGEVAEHAEQFGRGEMVTVTGKVHPKRYVDNDGVAQVRDEFILSSITWAE